MERIHRQEAVVAAALAREGSDLLLEGFQFFQAEQRRHMTAACLLFAIQCGSECPHESGNIRTDDFDAHLFLKSPQHGFVIEGTALHDNLSAELFRACAADDFI